MLAGLFLDHASRILVFAKSDELRMPQPVSLSPCQEFNLSDGLWPQPQCRVRHNNHTAFFIFSALSSSPNRDRLVSGKFTNGQVDVTRCFNFENTCRLDARTNPFRVLATYISSLRHSTRRSASQSRAVRENSDVGLLRKLWWLPQGAGTAMSFFFRRA